MNTQAMIAAGYIFVCLMVSFICGYFAIPSIERKRFTDEVGWLIGLIFGILVFAGGGYYLVAKQNQSVVMIILLLVGLGIVIFPITVHKYWTR